jgi:hypothetical protein
MLLRQFYANFETVTSVTPSHKLLCDKFHYQAACAGEYKKVKVASETAGIELSGRGSHRGSVSRLTSRTSRTLCTGTGATVTALSLELPWHSGWQEGQEAVTDRHGDHHVRNSSDSTVCTPRGGTRSRQRCQSVTANYASPLHSYPLTGRI